MNTVVDRAGADLEDRLVQFEEAWRSGVQPDLDVYLTPSSTPRGDDSSSARVRELLDLIPLDLEYRWREPASRLGGSIPPRPRLEHYLARYPELSSPSGGLAELVGAEYRIRRIWGDRPDLGECLGRFPALAQVLPDHLGRIDDEIAREYLGQGSDSEARPMAAAVPNVRSEASGELIVEGLEILGELGRGGMGVVSKARDVRLGRLVALKTIYETQRAAPEALERFRLEAQAVARLDHHNIVQIHEVGEQRGRPYVVLEYVAGGSLEVRLKENPLAPRQAAELVATLAVAVDAVHRAGIIHRDLKPSNILMAVDGTPKVSDFGLAKLLDEDSARTASGELLGSPCYMAPEQAAGHARQVGRGTDVYALGVILFEALTGRPPFLGQSRQETLNLIMSTDPVPPRRLRPEVPRDLDAICLKCLEKDPRHRYATAADLAADLRRYLAGATVQARPVGPTGRLWRWCRRNPKLAGLAAALFLAFALGTPALLGLWLRARTDRGRAVTEAENAKSINEFLRVDLLAQASAFNQARPGILPDPDLKVRTALDRAAGKIGERFALRPISEATIRQTIGETYYQLGLYPQALPHLERSLALYRRELGDHHPDALNALRRLGLVHLADTRLSEAEPFLREAMNGLREGRGRDHSDTLAAINAVAQLSIAQGKVQEAESLLSEARERCLKTRGAHHFETLEVTNTLATVYEALRKLDQSESLLKDTLRESESQLGLEHPFTLNVKTNLAITYKTRANITDAERLLKEVLDVQERVLGPNHSETLRTMVILAEIYQFHNGLEKAEILLLETLRRCRLALDRNHETTDTSLALLAALYSMKKQPERAIGYMIEALKMTCDRVGPDHVDVASGNRAVGSVFMRLGKFAEAEPYLRESWRIYLQPHPDNLHAFWSEVLVGISLLGQKRLAEAEARMLSGYQGIKARAGTLTPQQKSQLSQFLDRIIQLYDGFGRKDKAEVWRKARLAMNAEAQGKT